MAQIGSISNGSGLVTLRPGQISDVASWPLLAASILLDILNVFLFFLQIVTQDDR